MTEFVFSADGLVLVVGAVAGLLVTKAWDNSAGQVSAALRLVVVRGRHLAARRPRQSAVVPSNLMPDFFRVQTRHAKLVIYELSLRPEIPIMDLLYFEYLRARLKEETIDRVVIVPWSGWRSEGNADSESAMRERLASIFGEFFNRVDLVFADDLQTFGESIFENVFFERVKSLGDSSFLREASETMGYRFKSYHDINQGHPETHQARSLIEHTIRGWLIYRYVESVYLSELQQGAPIGSLMWECELTKLLMLQNLTTSHPQVNATLLLGASVEYRRGFRRRPIPTFAGDDALHIFGPLEEQVAKLRLKGRPELVTTQRLLSEILLVRSATGLFSRSSSLGGPTLPGEAELRDEATEVLSSMRRLRAIYGV